MDYAKLFDLTGQVAAITGGARGIGLEVATALGGRGAKIVLCDLDKDAADAAVAKLGGAGILAEARRLDVTVPEEASRVADEIVAQHGRIDILVNNAGIARITPALETDDAEWRLIMDVNLNGVFWCARAFGRHMVAAGSGSVVNLGSMSGTIVNRPQSAAAYIASKGAVHMLTKALACEWASRNVRVNAVAPGYIATDMTLAMRARPELFETWMDMTPMGRCGEPSEVAAAILFLASPAGSYVTGAVHAVDGGYTAW
ncbi:SDR family NAD(P)-dependent oxidoreductase [Aureimonas sp. AU4]|uniref:SDR family NAD(P)-dependent oxidoreductase n=1 Tax=Aureimonas sp. AU4 TaxID=1638163 RepID=UPI000784931A|nr:SDR family oxidoreductase [Aureimonas sp. AU4]